MPPIYVVQQGSKVRIRNRRLTVNLEHEGASPQTLTSIPINQVSQVVLFGNIGITTPAMGWLMSKGVEVIFLTRGGKYRGRLTSGLTPHVRLRRKQYEKIADVNFQLKLAKTIVAAKLNNQKYLLQRQNRHRPVIGMEAFISRINQSLDQIERKTKLSSLRGLEGTAAAAYFLGYHAFFEKEWRFEKRNRRPPRDPVNAMLSFGYTLLAHAVTSAVQSVGFDPYAGFLHEVVYNRPALGLDLMEEFRPVIDGIVLRAVNTNAVSPTDFSAVPTSDAKQEAKYAIYLSDDAKRNFIRIYENRMKKTILHPLQNQKLSLRQCILEQARALVRYVEKDEPYQGMRFR